MVWYAAVDNVSTDIPRRTVFWDTGSWAFSLVRGHFHEIGIAAFPLGLEPRRVDKWRECRFTGIGKSDLTEINGLRSR